MTREKRAVKGMVRIDCPLCKRFLAYIPERSNLYCPRCRKWIYEGMGGGDNSQEQEGTKAQGGQAG